MKENTVATNFEPHEIVNFVQSTKIGTYKNKAIHSISQTQNFGPLLIDICFQFVMTLNTILICFL